MFFRIINEDNESMHWYPCTGRRESADIVFMLDESGSIEAQNYYRMIDFVKELITELQPSDDSFGFGVLTFSDVERLRLQLRQYRTKFLINNALTFRYPRGTTETARALQYACNNMFFTSGDRSDKRNFLVVFTDGSSNNAFNTRTSAYRCHERGVIVLVVAIGDFGLRMSEVYSIASDPNDKNVFKSESFRTLPTIKQQLLDTLSNGEIQI